MSGDYSRFGYKPEKRYSSVWMQQGRVQLDSDWIEQAELLKRRWETQAADTFGNCAVPRATTPNAFKIGIATGSSLDLTLGDGRFYAGGRQAELFKNELPITYLNQPYLPSPPILANGDNLIVYLDVWDREITYIEDPDLLEKALGGPDTTTRVQTVWQVKVHKHNMTDGSAAACGFDLATIPDNHKSGGQLSTKAIVAPPQPDDPCIIAPSGGFRGLENRLYRVEIHSGTTLANAKYKWSRDNASLVSSVTQITQIATPAGMAGMGSVLKVTRLGRDQIMRFKVNDWVEITDDHRELKGSSGVMAKILTPPDEVNLTITLDRDLGTGFNPGDATRHTRIRRWDQQADVDLNGLLSVGGTTSTSTWLTIEDGVQVKFNLDPSTAQFRTGDYWNFAARTVDGSVEILVDAPPRGVRHHYCQLATINNLQATAKPLDCRNLWSPDEGCCTFVVHPGESIQSAIDALPKEGGCVCLKAGLHIIDSPITIKPDRRNVHLHGESLGSVVRRNGLTCLDISGMFISNNQPAELSNIRVENLRFESIKHSDSESSSLLIRNCTNVVIENCQFLRQNRNAQNEYGALVVNSSDIDIDNNYFDQFAHGIMGIDVSSLKCQNNHIEWRAAANGNKSGQIAIWLTGKQGDYQYIEMNQIHNYLVGVFVQEKQRHTFITRNKIVRQSIGLTASDLFGTSKIFAIITKASQCIIAENDINLPEFVTGGILATGTLSMIINNFIHSTSRASGVDYPQGIVITAMQESGLSIKPSIITIAGNHLTGSMSAIYVDNAVNVKVLNNHIGMSLDNDYRPYYGIVLYETSEIVVANNQIDRALFGILIGNQSDSPGENSRIIGNSITNGREAVSAINQINIEIADNRIDQMRTLGIICLLSRNIICSRNYIRHCGYDPQQDASSNILSSMPKGALIVALSFGVTVENCEIMQTGVSDNPKLYVNESIIGLLLYGVNDCYVHGNRIGYSSIRGIPLDITLEHRAMLLAAFPVVLPDINDRVQVQNNQINGVGNKHLVEFTTADLTSSGLTNASEYGQLIFSNNMCEHLAPPAADVELERATVMVKAVKSVISSNHINRINHMPSFNLNNANSVAVIGNICFSFINVGSIVPSPLNSFNVIR